MDRIQWKKVKLGELYVVHNGLSKGREFFGSGYPFLSFSTVFNNWFLPKELDSLVQSSDCRRKHVVCRIYAEVFARLNGKLRVERRRV